MVSTDTISEVIDVLTAEHPAVQIDIPDAFPEQGIEQKRPGQSIVNEIAELLDSFEDVLKNELPAGHAADLTPCVIKVIDPRPVFMKPYRNPVNSDEIIQKEITRLLEVGIIEKAESEYNSPILIVPKKDQSARFCVDYRQLNSRTESPATVLPAIEDHLYRFNGAQLFTVIDLTQGYHQLRIDPESQKLTAFSAGGQQYVFKRLPFGLKQAPALFSARLAAIINYPFTRIYLDDIIIYSKDMDTHKQHIKIVLETLRKFKIIAKRSKCQWAKKEVEYLGHAITSEGIKPTAEKIEAFEKLSAPATHKELKSLLGLLSFYRRYIKSFAKRTQSMHAGMKQQLFQWDSSMDRELLELKNILKTAMLQHPDFKQPFVVFTDASDTAIGGTINQEVNGVIKPVTFLSRQLTTTEQSYNIVEKEALAMVYIIERARNLLAFNHFTVYTDNSALLSIFRTNSNRRLSRYALRLSEFSFTLKHVPGQQNGAADFLSRIQTLERVEDKDDDWMTKEEIILAQEQDEKLQQRLLTNDKRYFKKDNMIYIHHGTNDFVRDLIVIPTSLIPKILNCFHDHRLMGHLSVRKTVNKLVREVHFDRLYSITKDYVRSCPTCQLRKGSRRSQAPLVPLKFSAPFQCLHIDLVGPLTTAEGGEKYICVSRDNFSRFAILRAIKNKTARAVAEVIVEIVGTFGVPASILTDRGLEFRNTLNKDLSNRLGIKRRFTSSYHPQTNSVAERFNSMIHNFVSIYLAHGNHKLWPTILPFMAYSWNTTVSPATGYTPFQLVFAHQPRNFIHDEEQPMDEATRADPHVRVLIDTAKQFWKLARHQKQLYDTQMSNVHRYVRTKFKVGDPVKIYSFAKPKFGQFQKWLPRWEGPFVIVEFLSSTNVTIQKGTKKQIVHLNRILPYYSRDEEMKSSESKQDTKENINSSVVEEEVLVPEDDEDLPPGYFLVEKIVRHRTIRAQLQYMVHWKGYDNNENTWELPENIPNNFIEQYHNERLNASVSGPQ